MLLDGFCSEKAAWSSGPAFIGVVYYSVSSSSCLILYYFGGLPPDRISASCASTSSTSLFRWPEGEGLCANLAGFAPKEGLTAELAPPAKSDGKPFETNP